MKRRFGQVVAAFACGVGLALGSLPAWADVIASDSFVIGASDYTAGSTVVGQNPANNGTDRVGWTGAWLGQNDGSLFRPNALGLDSPAVNYETGGGIRITIGSPMANREVYRNIDGSYTPSATYYASGMLSFSTNFPFFINDRAIMRFWDPDNGSSGFGFGFDGNPGNHRMDCILEYKAKGGGLVDYTLLANAAQDTTYYFIVKAVVDLAGDDVFTVWLNPTDVSSEAAAAASAAAYVTGLVSDDAFKTGDLITQFRLFVSQLDMLSTEAYAFDEPRFGTTWADVTGGSDGGGALIPEPAAAGIVGFLLLGLTRRKKTLHR